jgi:Tfp pilus assembly protein PilN
LLRALPRTSASPRFTSDVMRAVRSGERRPAATWTFIGRTAAAFAMAVCLIVVVQAAIVVHHRQQRIDSLRAEQQRIQAELAAVKQAAVEAEPIVVFEHDDGTRVVVEPDTRDSAATPVSYSYD